MSTSINTNIAAYYAQANIQTASDNAAKSISRLSSGNRIVSASDDVAALATGASLGSTISALQSALTNSSQGNSLLQVADGALGQITSILQQQQSIAQQAGSGSLTDTDRAFLDLQFQGLTAEIDSIAKGTSFNGVNLLDGSLSATQTITTNTGNTAASSGAGSGIAQATNIATIASGSNASLASGDTITIDGITATFAAANSGVGTTASNGKIIIGASNVETADNIARYFNDLKDPRLAGLSFTSTSGGAVEANYTGGKFSFFNTSATLGVTSSVNTANAVFSGTGTATIANTNTTDQLGEQRTIAVGDPTGTLLANGGTTAGLAGLAVDLSGVENNAAFTGAFGGGNIGEITATQAGTNAVVFNVKVGNVTYTSGVTTLYNGTAQTEVATFTGHDANGAALGGTFKLNLNSVAIATGDVATQAQVNTYTQKLNQALSSVQAYQSRTVSSFVPTDTVTSGGLTVGSLRGTSISLKSNDFTNPVISSFTITSPAVGQTDAVFKAVINGETYVSGAGVGNQIGTNTIIGLQSVDDPAKQISIVTSDIDITGTAQNAQSGTALDLGTQAKANAVAAAFQSALGLNNASGGAISFQVGAATSDTIGVSLDSVTSASLFGGQSLDVKTTDDAASAVNAVADAINTVTAVRSQVGAYETQFGFASANLQSSIQNQQSAQSGLLDTDVATESTSYATQQVKLQAGISVLAQANQQLQNLLKLIQ